jgi:hypothetical protein
VSLLAGSIVLVAAPADAQTTTIPPWQQAVEDAKAQLAAGAAQTQAQLATGAQALIADAVTKRQATISTIDQALSTSPDTCGYNASFGSTLTSTSAALTNINAEAAATTDLATLAELGRQIGENHRVYLLRVPQSWILAGCNASRAVVQGGVPVATSMQQVSAKLSELGADTSAADTAIASAQASMANADQSAQSAADTALALQPDGGNAAVLESNSATLATTGQQFTTISAELQSAKAQLELAYTELKLAAESLRND